MKYIICELRWMKFFGENNFIGSFVWEGTGKNDARFISVGHDYILCYANRIETLTTNSNRWRALKEGVDEIQRTAQGVLRTERRRFRRRVRCAEGLVRVSGQKAQMLGAPAL